MHAAPFASPLVVRPGDYADLDGAAVVILTAGSARSPARPASSFTERNAAVFKAIIPQVLAAAEAILVVTTNPVDVMTQIATQISKLPPAR